MGSLLLFYLKSSTHLLWIVLWVEFISKSDGTPLLAKFPSTVSAFSRVQQWLAYFGERETWWRCRNSRNNWPYENILTWKLFAFTIANIKFRILKSRINIFCLLLCFLLVSLRCGIGWGKYEVITQTKRAQNHNIQ